MDENARKWYGIAAAILVVFIAAAWYFSAHNEAIAPGSQLPTATTTNQTVTTGVTPGVSVANTSGYQMPDLNRPFTPSPGLPASVQSQSKQTVAKAIEQLKIDPNHLAYWLELAVYRKGAGDYKGAEEVWVYCTKVWPKDPVSYGNLGDLYANYLKDYSNATVYWTKLISLEPTNVSAYLNLATMQSITMKDTAAARTTLQAGLKANPGHPNLQYALDHLQ